MNFIYNIICKESGEDPKLIRVSRDFITKLKRTYEMIPIARGIVIALNPEDTFDDENYNCTLRIPENDGKIFAFGTLYLIRKRLFFFSSFKPTKTSFIFSGLFVTSKRPKNWWD